MGPGARCSQQPYSWGWEVLGPGVASFQPLLVCWSHPSAGRASHYTAPWASPQ